MSILAGSHQIWIRQVAITYYLVQLLALLGIEPLQTQSCLSLLDDLVTLVIPVELHLAEVRG